MESFAKMIYEQWRENNTGTRCEEKEQEEIERDVCYEQRRNDEKVIRI